MEVGGNGSEFLRIGTSSVPAQWFVPTILSGFLKKNVNTQVEMTSADSLDIIRRVKEGSLDIGFVGTKVEKAVQVHSTDKRPFGFGSTKYKEISEDFCRRK